MPALHVRDVPDSVMAALRERAAARNRSVQREVRDILARAAEEPVVVDEIEPFNLITTRTGGRTSWPREEIYGDAAR